MLQIILVEDNPAEAQLLQRAIEKTGLPVQVAVIRDGLEAAEHFSGDSRDCDLVLLDLNLPKLSGLEVLAHIRAQEELRDLPIVVLSGSTDPADIERSYRAGANSYVCKPVHLNEIYVMANRLVTYWTGCARVPPRRPPASVAQGARGVRPAG